MLQLCADLCHETGCLLSKIIAEPNRMSSSLCVRIDGASRHSGSQHFLKAQCLRAKLQIGVRRPPPPDLVFHGERRPVRAELHDVGFAAQPEPLRPQRQATDHPDPGPVLVSALVDTLVCELAANGVDVLLVGLFNVYQRTLSRAVGEVLDRRDRDIKQVLLVPRRGRVARQSAAPFLGAPCTTTRLSRRASSGLHRGSPRLDHRPGVQWHSQRTSAVHPRRSGASARGRTDDVRPRCRACCRD